MIPTQALRDWIDFCEGRQDFNIYHFGYMFMELFLKTLTEKDVEDIKTVFSYFEAPDKAVELMLKLDTIPGDISESEIEAFVKKDLMDRSYVIADDAESEELVELIRSAPIRHATSLAEFEEAQDSEPNQLLTFKVSVAQSPVLPHGRKLQEIANAFYGLASDIKLSHALTSCLMPDDPDVSTYFELYFHGVDYAVAEEEVLFMRHSEIEAERRA